MHVIHHEHHRKVIRVCYWVRHHWIVALLYLFACATTESSFDTRSAYLLVYIDLAQVALLHTSMTRSVHIIGHRNYSLVLCQCLWLVLVIRVVVLLALLTGTP